MNSRLLSKLNYSLELSSEDSPSFEKKRKDEEEMKKRRQYQSIYVGYFTFFPDLMLASLIFGNIQALFYSQYPSLPLLHF